MFKDHKAALDAIDIPPLSQAYWTHARLELQAWLQRNAASLAELYGGAARLVYDTPLPGRVRFVCHAVREIRNRLPDVLSGATLGRTLATVVTSAPERFAASARRFIGLDPTYVRALLQGFHDAAKQKRTFAWPQIMELCHWIIEQPRAHPGREPKGIDADPDWGWTRKAIADLSVSVDIFA
jgi:hypothetical protein